MTCTLDFWKALFRKCLLNNRKVQANIRKYLLYVLQKGCQLPVYFPKLCVKNELDGVKLDPSLS